MRYLLVILLCTGCVRDTFDEATETRDRVMPAGECMRARGGEHGDDVVFCTDGKALLICVEDSVKCFVVGAGVEVQR